MVLFSLNLTHSLLDGSASITSYAQSTDALFLHIPQHHRPPGARVPRHARCGHPSHAERLCRAGCCCVHPGPGRAEFRPGGDAATCAYPDTWHACQSTASEPQVRSPHGTSVASAVVSQGFFPCLSSGCRPTVHGLTRDLMRTTPWTDVSMHGGRQQVTDHAHMLLNSATMVPVSSPLHGDGFHLFTFSLRDSCRPLFRHMSQ